MRKPETVFINSVHKHLPPELHRSKNHNIYAGGQFDCWYSGRSGDLWLEYKFIVLPKREKTAIVPNLSALQLEWAHDRFEEGRNLAVIVGCKEGGVIYTRERWKEPISAGDFRSRLVRREKLAEWITGQVHMEKT